MSRELLGDPSHEILQSFGALQLDCDTAANPAGKMILPADIMNIVLDYCEQASCLAVLYTCRSYHSIAIPHVYREITVSTPRQLRAFIHTAEQAAYDDRIARQFYHTRAFHYRIKQGSTAITSSKIKMPKLYTSLRDVPSHTSDGKILFPRLKSATFEQVPAGGDDCSYKPTFLSDVKTVHLEHSPLSLYDCPPDFHALGMQDVRELHMYHLAGCEVNHESYLGTYLNYQGSLEKVYLHLASHFDNTVCSDQPVSRPHTLVDGLLQVMRPPRTRRSIDTTIYIHEYADAVAMISASVAYAQITANSRYHRVYPALQQVVVDIGSDRQSAYMAGEASTTAPASIAEECTDRQLLLKRCKREMLRYRERAERHHLQGTHVPDVVEDGKAMSLPDMYLTEGYQCLGWLLSGHKHNQEKAQQTGLVWQQISDVSRHI